MTKVDSIKKLLGKHPSKKIADLVGTSQQYVLIVAYRYGVSLKKREIKASKYFNEHERENWLI